MLAAGTWARRYSHPERASGSGGPDARDLEEEAPRLEFTRRHVLLFLVFVVATLAFLYYVLPQIAGLEDTWERIERRATRCWLLVALVLTLASFGGYIVLFHAVFVRAGSPIDLRASYQITMAGLAATRLFGAGGAGGIALTAWALRRSGMPRREVADQTLAFLILQYSIYTVALVRARPRPAHGDPARAGAVRRDGRPGDLRARRDVDRARARRGPHRSAAAPGRLRRAAAAGLARIAQRLANVPAAFSAGMHEALDARAQQATRRSPGRSRSGASTSGPCGPRSTPSATRRRSG